jgi:hypothetical protein
VYKNDIAPIAYWTRANFRLIQCARRKPNFLGHAIAEVVSYELVTMGARFRSQVGLCGNCGGQFDTEIGFYLSISAFSCNYYSTNAPFSFIQLSVVLYNLTN